MQGSGVERTKVYDDENDSFDLDFLDVEVNESELVSFMNEYYMITNDIPNSEFEFFAQEVGRREVHRLAEQARQEGVFLRR